jgi:SAM-dependent methyltransferase
VPSFEDQLAEGAAVDVAGWDFSWFEGRATEERPPWGYARMLGARMSALAGVPDAAALDLQTGGGEVLASIPAGPPVLAATESWPPNIAVASRNLARLGARVVPVENELADLPFADAAFDLVVSRHPVAVPWGEVARVLKPGGTYFSQDVGDDSVRELTEFMMGPRPAAGPEGPRQAAGPQGPRPAAGPEGPRPGPLSDSDVPARDPKWSVLAAKRAGLTVTDLREFRGRMEFGDAAAVVHFLRKVIWIVPGFTVDVYRDRLRALHEHIQADGPFLATTVRFLIEAHKDQAISGKPAEE